MTRVIIIGGTGMLSHASREISHVIDDLLLIARNPDTLAKDIGARSLRLDWKEKSAVNASICTLKNEPKADILISWLHEDGLWCLPLFEDLLIKDGRSIRIHGSAVGDPAEGIKTDPIPRTDIFRQNVVLGWIDESNGQRWLTNHEISEGVLTAFKYPEKTSIIVGHIDSREANMVKTPTFNKL
ncbi:MAG: hypothetical protein JSS53_09595 [Proteobacteria bacterium]|nr:hypothetical protein [Pseudomonadota bacterium]